MLLVNLFFSVFVNWPKNLSYSCLLIINCPIKKTKPKTKVITAIIQYHLDKSTIYIAPTITTKQIIKNTPSKNNLFNILTNSLPLLEV